MLIPSESYRRSIQLLLGLFILFCFLSPLGSTFELPHVDLEEIEEKRVEIAGEIESQTENHVIVEVEQSIQQPIEEVLARYKIAPKEIYIQVVAIEEHLYAQVEIPQKEGVVPEDIKRELETATQMQVNVIYYRTEEG